MSHRHQSQSQFQSPKANNQHSLLQRVHPQPMQLPHLQPMELLHRRQKVPHQQIRLQLQPKELKPMLLPRPKLLHQLRPHLQRLRHLLQMLHQPMLHQLRLHRHKKFKNNQFAFILQSPALLLHDIALELNLIFLFCLSFDLLRFFKVNQKPLSFSCTCNHLMFDNLTAKITLWNESCKTSFDTDEKKTKNPIWYRNKLKYLFWKTPTGYLFSVNFDFFIWFGCFIEQTNSFRKRKNTRTLETISTPHSSNLSSKNKCQKQPPQTFLFKSIRFFVIFSIL